MRIALRVGAYQILFLDRIPAYAAVDDAVEACKQAGGAGVAGFANALLRRLARDGEPPLPDAAVDPGGYLAAIGLPDWLARLLLAELPPPTRSRSPTPSARPAPVTLRANTCRVTRDELAARLPPSGRAPCWRRRRSRPTRSRRGRWTAPATTAAWRDGLFADRGRRRAGRRRAVRRGAGRADHGRLRGQRRQDRAPAVAGRATARASTRSTSAATSSPRRRESLRTAGR